MEHLFMHGFSMAGGLPLMFLLGFIMSFNPCMLAMLPLAGGYVASGNERNRKGMAAAIWLSFASALAAQGLAAGWLGAVLGGLQKMLPYLLGVFYLFLGAYTLNILGKMMRLLPIGIQGFYVHPWASRRRRAGLPGVISLGALLGFTPAPCITPVVLAVLGYSAYRGDPWQAVLALFFYGLGHGLPLALAGIAGCRLRPFALPWLRTISGVALLGLGVFFLLAS